MVLRFVSSTLISLGLCLVSACLVIYFVGQDIVLTTVVCLAVGFTSTNVILPIIDRISLMVLEWRERDSSGE